MAAYLIKLTRDLRDPHVVTHWPGDLVWGDSEANVVRVTVTMDGEPVQLSGTVVGRILRADGQTLVWDTAPTTWIDGSDAVVLLPASAYSVSGPATLSVALADGDALTTLVSLKLMVNASTSTAEVAPVDTVPDLQQLVAKIAEMEEATEEARDATEDAIAAAAAGVRTDTAAQGLTETQKSNARTNIAAASTDDFVFLRDSIIAGWEKGSIVPTTGVEYSSNTQIRNTVAQGVKTGVSRIYSTDLLMYVMAWDGNGDFVGFYNANRQFSKVSADYQMWPEFDCTAYPDYVFRVVAQYETASSSITAEDGKKVKFCPTDQTMTVHGKAADAASVGWKLAFGLNDEHVFTKDDFESGSWNYTKKQSNAKRLRIRALIPVKVGTSVTYFSSTLKVFIGVFDTETATAYSVTSGWVNAGTVGTFTLDGYVNSNITKYLIVMLESGSNITPDSYDGDIIIRSVAKTRIDEHLYPLMVFGDTTAKGWRKGSIIVTTGHPYGPSNQIVMTTPHGVKTGTNRITSDGVVMYILAYTEAGEYIGFYNSNREFSKAAANYATWTDFDCTAYPDYLFRIVAQFETASDSITVADGDMVHFHTTDTTLAVEDKPADAKAVGDRFEEEAGVIGAVDKRVTFLEDYTISDWESGSLLPSTGAEYASANQIRTAEKRGVSTGIGKVASSDFAMYIMAWNLTGTYIGCYSSSHTFTTTTSSVKAFKTFDCTVYPQYVFRFVSEAVSGIEVEDGDAVKFTPTLPDTVDRLQQRMETIGSYRKIAAADLESGSWSYSDKVANSKRLRSKGFFPVRAGMDIYYTNPTLQTYFGVLETPQSFSVLQASGWLSPASAENVYHIAYDGYLYIIVQSASDITVSDYDCEIEIRNEAFYRHDIEGGNTDLFKVFQRVGVIGDSISVGYIDENYPVRNLIYSWPKKVMQDAGVPWLNFGTSGQTTLTWASDSTYGKVQMEATNNKCQAYLICLGCNDEWDTFRHVDLGTTSDIVDDPDTVATTYYGGYNRIIQLLKRRNPDCKIFCVTNPVATESLGYNNAVRYLATQHYTAADGVFLLELAMKYRRNINENEFGIKPDRIGVHYSPYGYRMIATLMEKVLGETIRNNRAYFQDVAGIAYDTGTPTANTMTE